MPVTPHANLSHDIPCSSHDSQRQPGTNVSFLRAPGVCYSSGHQRLMFHPVQPADRRCTTSFALCSSDKVFHERGVRAFGVDRKRERKQTKKLCAPEKQFFICCLVKWSQRLMSSQCSNQVCRSELWDLCWFPRDGSFVELLLQVFCLLKGYPSVSPCSIWRFWTDLLLQPLLQDG